MRKVHEKSIILGIGIGMIITSIAGMIYSGGVRNEPTKEEIIRLAKGYGMVEKAQIINNGAAADSTAALSTAGESENSAAGNTDTVNPPDDNNAAAQSTTAEKAATGSSSAGDESEGNKRNITVKIPMGTRAKALMNTLVDKGVIADGDEFMSVMKSYKATTRITIGTYKFKKNEDPEYVVKTVCSIKQ